MVGPTNLNPSAPSSLDILIDNGVEAGTLAVVGGAGPGGGEALLQVEKVNGLDAAVDALAVRVDRLVAEQWHC